MIPLRRSPLDKDTKATKIGLSVLEALSKDSFGVGKILKQINPVMHQIFNYV